MQKLALNRNDLLACGDDQGAVHRMSIFILHTLLPIFSMCEVFDSLDPLKAQRDTLKARFSCYFSDFTLYFVFWL